MLTRIATCSSAALAALLMATSAHAQCGVNGSCYEVHGGGCEDVECCNAVCTYDWYCCGEMWDEYCIGLANDFCKTAVVAGPFANPFKASSIYIVDRATWAMVKEKATAMRGHLVTIHSAEENQWVTQQVMQAGFAPNFFIGLSDLASEGSFVWEDGKPVNVTFWDAGQPDNYGPGEDVVHIWSADGKWNDLPSTYVQIGVIEVEDPDCGVAGMGDCTSIHGPYCDDASCCEAICLVDPSCCQTAWDQDCVGFANLGCNASPLTGRLVNPLTGRSYAVLNEAYWTVAKAEAEAIGGKLVTVDSGTTNEFIRRWLTSGTPSGPGSTVWLGASDAASEGTFAWESGAPFLFSRWAPGEPNSASNEDVAGMMSATGGWNDFGWQHRFQAIVEFRHEDCGQGGDCFAAHPGKGCNVESCCNSVCDMMPWCCDYSWDTSCALEASFSCVPVIDVGPVVNPVTKHAYYGVAWSRWQEAERLAIAMGGHLAVPNNAAEGTWLALNFLAGEPGFPVAWIGVHEQLQEGIFRAVDTTHPVTYTNWYPGEPNFGFNDDVVAITGQGKWFDTSPNASARAIIEVPCLGDINLSGTVDAADLALLLGSWGNLPAPSDLNIDGAVDAADLAVLLGGWGPCLTSDCCSIHGETGCDQPGCMSCVCEIDPWCCQQYWDSICVAEAGFECNGACQCGG